MRTAGLRAAPPVQRARPESVVQVADPRAQQAHHDAAQPSHPSRLRLVDAVASQVAPQHGGVEPLPPAGLFDHGHGAGPAARGSAPRPCRRADLLRGGDLRRRGGRAASARRRNGHSHQRAPRVGDLRLPAGREAKEPADRPRAQHRVSLGKVERDGCRRRGRLKTASAPNEASRRTGHPGRGGSNRDCASPTRALTASERAISNDPSPKLCARAW